MVFSSHPLSEKLWIGSLHHMEVYLHVVWLFQPPGTSFAPQRHRKDRKHGRSLCLVIFVLWPYKAAVTSCECYNQAFKTQLLFYVSTCVCNFANLQWFSCSKLLNPSHSNNKWNVCFNNTGDITGFDKVICTLFLYKTIYIMTYAFVCCSLIFRTRLINM
jgi:hypothetical protein